MVRDGTARGFFTAGNTGAAMATAKMVLGMLAGVHRPALATIIPTVTGTPSLLLDVGANVDCDPDNLVQFAVMGQHVRAQRSCIRPSRGWACSRSAKKTPKATRSRMIRFRCCAQHPALHFIGNVEGRDLFNGRADVAVCDGFVGNVALKTCEGDCQAGQSTLLREALKSTVTSQVGALLSRRAFNDFKKRLDYSEYGGAPLLGVRGVCIVGHGSSNERAIMNGIRVAAEFAQAEVNSSIESALRGQQGLLSDR